MEYIKIKKKITFVIVTLKMKTLKQELAMLIKLTPRKHICCSMSKAILVSSQYLFIYLFAYK